MTTLQVILLDEISKLVDNSKDLNALAQSFAAAGVTNEKLQYWVVFIKVQINLTPSSEKEKTMRKAGALISAALRAFLKNNTLDDTLLMELMVMNMEGINRIILENQRELKRALAFKAASSANIEFIDTAIKMKLPIETAAPDARLKAQVDHWIDVTSWLRNNLIDERLQWALKVARGDQIGYEQFAGKEENNNNNNNQ